MDTFCGYKKENKEEEERDEEAKLGRVGIVRVGRDAWAAQVGIVSENYQATF